MKEADIAITPIPQADGEIKNRPVLLLRKMPGYGDWLVCGISTQLHHYVVDFDELLNSKEPDFASSGLVRDSIIRLGFLAVVPSKAIAGTIGSIDPGRHKRLLQRLSAYLVAEFKDQ